MRLLNDVARCNGVGYDEGNGMEWREGCENCARRLCIVAGHTHWWIEPPPIISFECEFLIPMEKAK